MKFGFPSFSFSPETVSALLTCHIESQANEYEVPVTGDYESGHKSLSLKSLFGSLRTMHRTDSIAS